MMGRRAYDTDHVIKKKKPPPIGLEAERIARERHRRNLWHYKYGFNGLKASRKEREAEEKRRSGFDEVHGPHQHRYPQPQ